MYSARQTVASLALCTATAFSRSSTVISSPGFSQIWLPPKPAATSLQVTVSSSAILPPSSASMISNRLMILVMEAGGSFSSAFISYSTPPVF